MKYEAKPKFPKSRREPIEFIDVHDLLKQPFGDEIPELLRDDATCIEGKNLESAAWPIADAVQMLQKRLKAKGFKNVAGVDSPTGRGAQLSLQTLK